MCLLPAPPAILKMWRTTACKTFSILKVRQKWQDLLLYVVTKITWTRNWSSTRRKPISHEWLQPDSVESGFPQILWRSLTCMQEVTSDTLTGNILFTARKVSQDSQLQRAYKNLVGSQVTVSLEPDGLAIACLCVGKQFSHTSYKCCHSNWYFLNSKEWWFGVA